MCQQGSMTAQLSGGQAKDRRTRSYKWQWQELSTKGLLSLCEGGRGNYSGEGGLHPSQTDSGRRSPSLAQVRGCLRTGTDLPASLNVRWFDARSNSGTGAGCQQGEHRRRVYPAGPSVGQSRSSRDHLPASGKMKIPCSAASLLVTCSLGNWMNFHSRHTKKHSRRNTPEMLITNKAFQTHLRACC